MATLSLPQLSYLQTSLASATPIRPDSRSLTQFRPISYASSVLPGCLGSAHLSWGPFSIIVGVKGQVLPSISGSTIDCSIEIQGERDDDPLATTLSETFTDLLNGLNRDQLRVAHGQYWHLSIDAILLSRDRSSPLPAMSLAIRLALLDTRLPRTMPSETEDGIKGGDYEVDDDFGNAVAISAAANFPLVTIVNYIGSNILFDASEEEETVLHGRLVVAVSEAGKVKMVRNLEVAEPRSGIQGRSEQRGISPEEIRRGVQEAVDVSLLIYKHVRAFIEEPAALFEIL